MANLTNTGESQRDAIISHLREKYDDDTIVMLSPFGGGAGGGSDGVQILFASERFPGAEMWAISYVEDGQTVFRDNYLNHKFLPQTTELFEMIAREAYGDDVVIEHRAGNMGFLRYFPADTPLSDFVSNPRAGLIVSITALYTPEDKDEAAVRLEAALIRHGVVGNGSVIFVGSSNDLQTLTDMDFSVLNNAPRMNFRMSDLSGFDYCEWR